MRLFHKAKLISPEGDVSPLCAVKPRKINMEKETWTTDPNAVTCSKCQRILREEEKVQKAMDIVIEQNREVFKELEDR